MIIVNELNTPITDNLLKGLDRDSINEFYDVINNIKLINHLVSDTRARAKDLPRKNGKIIVNLEELHVLEDMDYFRQSAIYFETHGVYTHDYPTKLKTSDYYRFWQEEARRCKEGHVRESDGEWIPGYYYFYLNYWPILHAVAIGEEEDNNMRGQRMLRFPDVWDSDYMYFHYCEQAADKGLFGNTLKTRGRGYSYKGSAKLARNFFFIENSKSYAFASDNQYLLQDGLLTKAWDGMSFVEEHTPWRKSKQKVDKPEHKRASYIDPNTLVEKGYKSEIIGVTTKDSPNKGRGKRGHLMIFEEAGNYPYLTTIWNIAKGSMKQGRIVYGFMEAFGTGGTVGTGFVGMERLFYDEGYNVYRINNIFDKIKGSGSCSFYVGEYMNRSFCYDKNGNSNVTKALVEILKERQEIRLGNPDPQALTKEKGDYSITPQEAVMRLEGTIFPVADLKEYLNTILPIKEHFVSSHLTPHLLADGKFGDMGGYPIRHFPLANDQKKTGSVEIFSLPVKDQSGKIPHYRYIIGVDPFDDDEAVFSVSLGSAIVFDTWREEIVAEYTGRPQFANDFYETCKRLAYLYNARINYENMNKGLFGYFNNTYCLHLLADNPKHLRDTEMLRDNMYGNKAKGTPATPRINQYARRLQRDWMLKRHLDSTDEDVFLNLHKIRSIPYLQEAIEWNPDGNFDRISAMGMALILHEEYLKYMESERNSDSNVSDLASDPFFVINYEPMRRKLLTENRDNY